MFTNQSKINGDLYADEKTYLTDELKEASKHPILWRKSNFI
jgi:hypothetical protein